ncbi:transposase, partial [Olsenella sp. KGMB02461]|nr:transposase [Olsenella sp. KGMB02461]
TADGARWIRQLVKRRCPNARWVMDPFHVVQWMNDALDAVRCEVLMSIFFSPVDPAFLAS